MKYILDMRLQRIRHLGPAYALLHFCPCGNEPLPQGIRPGQFVQVQVPDSPSTFLRRPISVCMADYGSNELWLLVRQAGAGTRRMIESAAGQVYNMILPLGNGFALPECAPGKILLAGGGVGVAPLLYFGKTLHQSGQKVAFALGARSANDLLLLDEFEKYGSLHLSTEDGSRGEKGFITQNSVFDTPISHIACCGPTPMMKAVAKIARDKGINCEVSLENMMACGIGACLCCVEDTVHGNQCVCTQGPVFNIKELKWQI